MLNYIHSHAPQQDIFFKPYTQKFHIYYDHNEGKNNYYITPDFGEITRLVGKNTILEGCDIANVSFDSTSATISISEGRLIINDTYIEVCDNPTITFDQLNMFDDSGFIVLSASFINNHHLRKNQVRYHLTYFNKNNKSYGEFNLDKDKIILGVFDFNKDQSNNVTNFVQRDIYFITLDSVNYKVRNTEKTVSYFSLDGGTLSLSMCGNENIIHSQFSS